VGGGPNMVIPDQAEANIELFKTFLDLSVELGNGIVCAESKHRPEDLPVDDAWASTERTVRAICDHAESVGAVLAIEAAGPCFISDHEVYLELKRRVGSDALKVNYDPANIVWAGKDVIEGVKAVADDIVHTHAKDIAKVVQGAEDTAEERLMDVPAGEGLVGYDTYIPALKAIGYDGFLTIEMHAGKEGRPDDIRKSVTNLKALI
jgi:sugar phosphate isomerase/epimerase